MLLVFLRYVCWFCSGIGEFLGGDRGALFLVLVGESFFSGRPAPRSF